MACPRETLFGLSVAPFGSLIATRIAAAAEPPPMRTNSTVRNIGPWRALQRYFLASDWEVVFGWNTAEFSLFAVFSPFVTKLAAINSCNRLVRWLKKEEDSLFINAILW